MTKEANTAVENVIEERNAVKGQKCKYTHFTLEQRAKIAKYAAECRNAATVRHFSSDYPTLRESTVRQKEQYIAEPKRKGPYEITDLPKKK